jgi:hypothetical protein
MGFFRCFGGVFRAPSKLNVEGSNPFARFARKSPGPGPGLASFLAF